VSEPVRWEGGKGESERVGRRTLEEIIINRIGEALPGFCSAEKKFVLSGTPRTFEHYTHRLHGMVGGVPHSVERLMWTRPKYRTPLEDFYLVGDTVYPGQGVPAVVLGALNLVGEIG
jgi:phytoene dehydrogenase-like protein